MPSTALVTACLAELAQAHRAPEPEFDAQGFARIPTSNGLAYECYLPKNSRQLIVFMLLGELPQENRGDFLLEALRANLYQHRNSGSVLAYHEQENLITVQQRRNLEALDAVTFQKAMRHLKEVADLWRGKLEILRRKNRPETETAIPSVSPETARRPNLFA